MKTRFLYLLCSGALVATCYGQGWSESYGRALAHFDSKDWTSARDAFKESIALRPEDQSSATSLPGTNKRWRSGAPYSPNFGAALCLYRTALVQSGPERSTSLKLAASEFETLLAKGQLSLETYYFLSKIYSAASDSVSSDGLSLRLREDLSRLNWKVDALLVSPEEKAGMASLVEKPNSVSPDKKNPIPGPTTTIVKATDKSVTNPITNIGAPPSDQDMPMAGRIPSLPNKFALVIGNSESAMADARLPFAATDAMMVRDALVMNAGFDVANIDVVTNASADQLRASAAALAERVPQDATIMIYFTGYGANVAGKDYYAGVDANSPKDALHMVAVSDVYKAFLGKGAYIFAFNQANRPINSGLYFGKETPLFGRISQSHATIPGSNVNALVTGGQEVGAYTAAFTDILSDFRSNQIPIMEFSWQVFYKMRRGGGPQTPTLPVLTVISADARF